LKELLEKDEKKIKEMEDQEAAI
jgi:hypothetical protein